MTTDTVGGVWNYSLELCRELGQYGVQVHLVSMGGWPSETMENEVSNIETVTLYKSAYKLEWMENSWEDVKNAQKWIMTIYHTVQPDIVHLNNFMKIENPQNCPVVTTYHSCVHTWWQAVKGKTAPSSWNTYKQLVKTALNNSNMIISPTGSFLEQIRQVHHLAPKTTVINNARNIAFTGKKEKEPFILCTGRIWDEAKNLQILSNLSQEIPWPIYVAGDHIDPVKGRKTHLENVFLLGKLPSNELSEWMQRASIYLSPAKYEPFGLAVLEAANAGCALALSNIGTLRELWGESAMYFDPTDATQIKRALHMLIQNPNYRKRLSEASKMRAKTYNAQKMGKQYMEMYQHLLSTKEYQLTC
ncbi:glycosyltransferase [Flagellimonas baculiformis]|uniref:glycosyltransferase n=1 Tax=Flagellimonas baculiformis TaxID=3067310 RepID=UPI00296E5E96|nr:glycosyltransferase [Muricauda sp. D6]